MHVFGLIPAASTESSCKDCHLTSVRAFDFANKFKTCIMIPLLVISLDKTESIIFDPNKFFRSSMLPVIPLLAIELSKTETIILDPSKLSASLLSCVIPLVIELIEIDVASMRVRMSGKKFGIKDEVRAPLLCLRLN